MTQTTSRFFDDMARLMSDAAGVANGVRQEVEMVVRGQAEKILQDMDVVSRDEFEAVKAMAQAAREENETLKARIEQLESQMQKKSTTKVTRKKTTTARSAKNESTDNS